MQNMGVFQYGIMFNDTLYEAMKTNGDQELIIMVEGKRFPIIEVYTGDDKELYIEGYTQ